MPAKPLEYLFPGIVAAQAIHAAVKFGIPDLLATGPKSAAVLAAECGANEAALERLLRALASMDMFARTPEGQYRNTPLTEVLRSDHPLSLQSEGMYLPEPFMWLPLGEMSDSIRTGKPAFEKIYGQSFFAYLAEHPEEYSTFNRMMTNEIMWLTPALLRAYDFSPFKCLVDVGGGQGIFMSKLLEATPSMTGILFDQPQVVAEAKKLLKDDLAVRTRFVGGDFFDKVPEGGDVYVMRRILHDWEDADAVRILANVRRVMSKSSILLLVEGLVDSPSNPVGLMDLVMLVFFRGRERTEAEFNALLQSAGFSLNRVVPAGACSVIECRPA